MKNKRYNISLYIIVPVIFSGIAVLALLLSYNLTLYFEKTGVLSGPFIFPWGLLLIVFSAISGVLIVKLIIGPVERFVAQTDKLGVLDRTPEQETSSKPDEMSRYTRAFEQVADFLGRVEARELFPEIVGQSRAMRAVFYQIIKVAPTESTVLIQGETGTGKEIIAESIHRHSTRSSRRFIALNCAAIPEGLLESELFGYEKGAFTGANTRKQGKLEAANTGTIFLDEIGDMPLSIQAKILRVIEESTVERVGGNDPVRVDVRFIAATNKDLASMVDKGAFREDLFFRLNVFTVNLPRLRERREDIPLLAQHFINQASGHRTLSSNAMQLLTSYDWPGNVRELKNALESACVLARDVIEPEHLPPSIRDRYPKMDVPESTPLETGTTLDDRVKEIEKAMIIDALSRSNGIQSRAAKLLGISDRSLWHRVKKHEIDPAEYKGSGR